MERQTLSIWCKENGEYGHQLLIEWIGKDDVGKIVDINSVTKGSNRRVLWKCEQCGSIWATRIKYRTIDKTGCPRCGRKKQAKTASMKNLIVGRTDLATTNPELAEEWNYSQNGSLSPTMVTSRSAKKVWWKCSQCEYEWQALISNRAKENGTGCPNCAHYWRTSLPEQVIYYYIKEVFPDAESGKKFPWLFHGSEIDVFIPSLQLGIEYDGYRWHKNMFNADEKKDKIILENGIKLIRVREYGCPSLNNASHIIETRRPDKSGKYLEAAIKEVFAFINHEYHQSIAVHIDIEHDLVHILGSFQNNKTKKSLLADNPVLCNEWDYQKNSPLKPEQVSYSSNLCVWWKCSACGYEWQATICNRNGRKSGCPSCTGKTVINGKNDLATLHPDVAATWNYQKNTDITPDSVSSGSNRRLWWLCPICGCEWLASPNSRCSGQGCPACGRKKAAVGNIETKLRTRNIRVRNPALAKEFDTDLNGGLTAETTSISYTQKLWWKCPNCGKSYQSLIRTRLSGSGCPYCGEKGKRTKKIG